MIELYLAQGGGECRPYLIEWFRVGLFEKVVLDYDLNTKKVLAMGSSGKKEQAQRS